MLLEGINVKKERINLPKITFKRSKAKKKPTTATNNDHDFNLYAFICIIYLVGILLGSIYCKFNIHMGSLTSDILPDSYYNDEIIHDAKQIFLKSVFKNLKVFIIFWIVGISAIGSPVLLFLCFYKGFKIAFTISLILFKMGYANGYIYVIHHLFWNNLFCILAMFFLTASSIKLSYNILIQKKDIKYEIIRHSLLSVLNCFLLFVSIICEVFLNN